MKYIISIQAGNYTFDASARTIAITGMSALTIEQILSIINITRNEIIYSPAHHKGGVGTISGNVISLDYDTTNHADTDKLQIFIERQYIYIRDEMDDTKLSINSDRQLRVIKESKIDTNNSTSNTLNANEVFTGVGTNISKHCNLTVQLFADQNSANNGMQFQFSTDNVNWDDTYDFTFTANEARRFQFAVTASFFRVVFTNDSVTQTEFRVQTILHCGGILTTIHRIKDAISEDNSAQLMKTVLSGENPGGIFINFQATTAGNFKISLEELENAVSVNSNSQLRTTLFDSSGNEFLIDLITNAFGTIDTSHHEIHEGDAYTVEHNNSGGSGIKATISFKTANTTKWIHLLASMRSNVESNYKLCEAPTITAASGSDYVCRNKNRNSGNTSGLISEGSAGGVGFVTLGATVSAEGLVLETLHFGQGKQGGGEGRNVREWVLKQDTIYALVLTSEAAASDITIEMHWYEHDPS